MVELLALEKRQISAKRKGSKRKGQAPKGASGKRPKQSVPRKATVHPHVAAVVAHATVPGTAIKTPAGPDGDSPPTSLSSSACAVTTLTIPSTAVGDNLFVFKPAFHNSASASNVAIQTFVTAGTVIQAATYNRTETFTDADMDDQRSAYKLNGHHVHIEFVGNPLSRTGSIVVFNPSAPGEYEYILPELTTYITTPSVANMQALTAKIKSSPIAKHYPLNKKSTVDISAPSMMNWTHSGQPTWAAFSKFGARGNYQYDDNLAALGNLGSMKLHGSEIFVVNDSLGGGGSSAISFNLKSEVSFELHNDAKQAFMTPSLPKSPEAAAALHGIFGALHTHNRSMDTTLTPTEVLKKHSSSKLSVAGKIGSFLYKNRGTEEKIALDLL